MKALTITLLGLGVTCAVYGKNVDSSKFHGALFDEVKQDIQQNDSAYRGRAPASVEDMESTTANQRLENQQKQLQKIEKNVKQQGLQDW